MDESDKSAYKQARRELAAIAARAAQDDRSRDVGARKKELERAREKIAWLLNWMDSECLLEAVHDSRAVTPLLVHERGNFAKDVRNTEFPTMKVVVGGLRCLDSTLEGEIERLPDPRKRSALPVAALGYLHLRYRFLGEPPALTCGGADVVEFGNICRDAGIHVSDDRLRQVLSAQLRCFDLHYLPPRLEVLARFLP